MELKTYDTLLNEMCDYLDSFISPKKITRGNTNVIYLVLKAFAKGLEIVNSVVVSLSNKFDPSYCSVEDLDSVAKLVGTERLSGSATGLQVNITNTSANESAVLYAGRYLYQLDSDNIFYFDRATDASIDPEDTIAVIAMSIDNKKVPVTEQASITVVREDEAEIEANLSFSCLDNAGLLGVPPESTVAFRDRIVQGLNTSSILAKLQMELKQLPNIFDAQIFFNSNSIAVVKGGVTVPAWHLLVVLSGNATEEVAEIVSKYSIFPTVVSENFVEYKNSVFSDGAYKVYYRGFDSYRYSLNILYKIDTQAVSEITVEREFVKALAKYKVMNTYTDIITEREFANLLTGLGLSTVQILDVSIHDEERGVDTDYIEIPLTAIAKLESVTITKQGA